ncbi:MAG: protein kinase [Acidobacteriota bacterium]
MTDSHPETIGEYRILEWMGTSRLGEVYRARDSRVGRTVEIDVLPGAIAGDPRTREPFLAAARRSAALSHPNIAALHEIGEEGSRVYLVREFVPGTTLNALVGGRPLNPRRAIDLAIEIADALADAHASGVAHGALDTDAIVVTPKGHAKVHDLGLAAWACPTPALTSPATDPVRADIAALGAVLFEMLTGEPPAAGARLPGVIIQAIPAEVDPVVARAIGEGARYESAAALAADLRAVAAVVDARKNTSAAVLAPSLRPRRTRVRRARVTALVVLALLAGLVWWYVRIG